MDISPKETILKIVRKNLLSLKTGQNTQAEYKVDAYKSLTDAEGVSGLQHLSETTEHLVFECKNKYHFLDKFIAFQKKDSLKTVACSDVKLKRLLDSCGIPYTMRDEQIVNSDVDLNPCDYWEPNGTLAAFDYAKSESYFQGDSGYKQEVLVAFRDQMVKSTEVLFERLKNRLRDTDLQKVNVYSIDPTLQIPSSVGEKRVVLFIINQRL